MYKLYNFHDVKESVQLKDVYLFPPGFRQSCAPVSMGFVFVDFLDILFEKL